MNRFILFVFYITFSFLGYGQKNDQLNQLSYAKIDSIAIDYYKKSDLESGLNVLKIGRANAKEEFGTKDSVYAIYTKNVGFFLTLIAKFKEAEVLYLEALEAYKSSIGENNLDYSTALNNLGHLYSEQGRIKEAESTYLKSKNIITSIKGKTNRNYSRIINNLADVYLKFGWLAKAEKLFLENIEIKKKIEGIQPNEMAGAYNNIAHMYQLFGDYNKAEGIFLKAIKDIENSSGKKHPTYATIATNLALLYQKMNRFDEAEQQYIEAKEIRAEIFGKKHPTYANSLNHLGTHYTSQNQLDKAEKLFLEAISIQQNVYSKEDPRSYISMESLAILYDESNRPEKAVEMYLKILEVYEKSIGKKHLNYARILQNLGDIYLQQNQLKKAERVLLDSKDIREALFGKNKSPYIESLNVIIALYLKMQDFEKCEIYINEAIQRNTKKQLKLPINKSWIDSLTNIEYLSSNQLVNTFNKIYKFYDPLDDSKEFQLLSTDLAQKILAEARKELSTEKDKLRFLEQSTDWMFKSYSVLKDIDTEKAFTLAENNKSVLLRQFGQQKIAYRFGDLPDSLAVKEQTLAKKRETLRVRMIEENDSPKKNKLRKNLNDTNKKIRALKEKIESEYPQYAKIKYNLEELKLEDVQELLDNNTALIEYVVGKDEIFIFYIDQNSSKWIRIKQSTKELNTKIKQLHRALSNYKELVNDEKKNYTHLTTLSYWFYQKLITPLELFPKNIENLIIITDGELGHLPFEAFLMKEAPQELTGFEKLHYLIKDYSVSYNYSASFWKDNLLNKKGKNNGLILGMAADYSLDYDSTGFSFRLPSSKRLRAALSPLEQAQKEVETLGNTFKGDFIFGTMANEKYFKERAQNHAVIHLAMHGILNKNAPELSSLAFTENFDTLENNFLQAYEISRMHLNADLVVLSACETGFGKFERGNGIASLARSFMYAGAPSLIVSLWQVNDFATSEVMKNLYDNLASGMQKDEALRQAKLQYMKTASGILAHPAFWSPFIQMGNTNPVEIKRKSNTLSWFIGGLAAIFILGGSLAIRRKKKEVV